MGHILRMVNCLDNLGYISRFSDSLPEPSKPLWQGYMFKDERYISP